MPPLPPPPVDLSDDAIVEEEGIAVECGDEWDEYVDESEVFEGPEGEVGAVDVPLRPPRRKAGGASSSSSVGVAEPGASSSSSGAAAPPRPAFIIHCGVEIPRGLKTDDHRLSLSFPFATVYPSASDLALRIVASLPMWAISPIGARRCQASRPSA